MSIRSENSLSDQPDNEIAIFEDRLILNAQPPISDAQLERVERRIGRKIPPGLVALWRTAFGGRLDYELDVDFNGHVAAFSMSELFFPESGGYHDLWGWIDHEFDCAEEVDDDNAKNGILDFLPFGGFEYLDRAYVCLEDGDDYGAVFAWMRGLPPAWSLRLHENSLAKIADDIPSLFKMLALESDPFADDRPEFCAGNHMVEAIDAMRLKDVRKADELSSLVIGTVLDWRASLDTGKIAEDKRLRRLAFLNAAERGDIPLIDRLVSHGCDLNERFSGGGNILDHLLTHGHHEAAISMIERGVDPSDAVSASAMTIPPDLLKRLLDLGATVDTVSAQTAALQGSMESAELMVDHLANRGELETLKMFATQLNQRASYDEKNSYSRSKELEGVAKLRKLESHIRSKLPREKSGPLPIFGRFFKK
jgi:hypothetical protein